MEPTFVDIGGSPSRFLEKYGGTHCYGHVLFSRETLIELILILMLRSVDFTPRDIATMKLLISITAKESPFCASYYHCDRSPTSLTGTKHPTQLWVGEWHRVIPGVPRTKLYMTEVGSGEIKKVTPDGVSIVDASDYNKLMPAQRTDYLHKLNPDSLYTFGTAACRERNESIAISVSQEAISELNAVKAALQECSLLGRLVGRIGFGMGSIQGVLAPNERHSAEYRILSANIGVRQVIAGTYQLDFIDFGAHDTVVLDESIVQK